MGCVEGQEYLIYSFRPLAGLSCINLNLVSADSRAVLCFRPLAGLSCINLPVSCNLVSLYKMFPSPRGVELHKPCA